MRAQYYWYVDVFEWSKKAPEGGEAEVPDNLPPEVREQIKKLLASSGAGSPTSFKSWLEAKEGVTVQVEGKQRRGRSGKLDYEHWVWLYDNQFGPTGISYCEAAVYDFEDRQVALVILMPLENLKPPKPKSKWRKVIDFMIKSGREVDREANGEDEALKKDKWADNPERKEALAAAKRNIAGLQGQWR